MNLLTIRNLEKAYQIDKTHSFTALKDINLTFADRGLHMIVGKSGSGKSTLLNIIARIDAPTKGEIYLNKQKLEPKDKRLYMFYRNDIGIVFQNFNLLLERTTLYNVALPLLIAGVNKVKAYKKAKETLRYVNISKQLYHLKTSKLSGGEKQRVAIARAIINNPKILLCDEPTGSLDSSNSEVVMNLIKKISETKLVIMVTHNLQIVNNYSDRVIELEDGRVINNYQRHKFNDEVINNEKTLNGISSWTSSFSIKNFKRRFKRNVFIIASLSICLIMGNLVAGFINGKDQAILNACYNQLDFGYGTISEEETVSNTGMIRLTKSIRPELNELSKEVNIKALFEICPNFSAILPQNLRISYDELQLENVLYTPIYSFSEPYYNSSLIMKGQAPIADSLNEVIINKKCYNTLKKQFGFDPLGDTISFFYQIEVNYVLEDGEYISDTFIYNISSTIVAVVDELDYLASNKIYYSYLALESFMQEYQLNNLSTYYDSKITWYDRVLSAENYSFLSSYSYQLFLKDYRYREYMFRSDLISEKYSFVSNSIVISKSLIDFLEVAKYALLLFLGISLIGATLILSIISLTNYSEDRKNSAVLSVLGAKTSEIENIYLFESIISGLISLILSLALSYPISILVNNLISKHIAIKNLVSIPLLRFLNIPFFYPLLLLGAVFILIYLSTLIPIKFSKHNSIRTELQNND